MFLSSLDLGTLILHTRPFDVISLWGSEVRGSPDRPVCFPVLLEPRNVCWGLVSCSWFAVSLSRVCRVLVEGFWLEFLSLDLPWREVIEMVPNLPFW